MAVIKNKRELFKFHDYKAVVDSINALEFAFYNNQPNKIIKEKLRLDTSLTVCDINNSLKIFDLSDNKAIYAISVGKASVGMLKAVYDIFKEKIKQSVLIMPKGQNLDSRCLENGFLKGGTIDVIKSSHPIPDYNSFYGSQKVIDLVKKAEKQDLIIFLISGGASSLIVSPLAFLTLLDKQNVNQYLLACGADIGEINIVRKHLSKIKGGNILKYINDECCVISLILSDVVGDRLDTIGSGLTYYDESTFLDSKHIMDKYFLSKKDDNSLNRAYQVLDLGIQSKIPETLKQKDFVKKDVNNFIVGNNTKFCISLIQYFKRIGYDLTYMGLEYNNHMSRFIDDSKEIVYKYLKKNSCILLGGEITNTVENKNDGIGGRNQESICHMLNFFCSYNFEDYSVICIGTDGIDGNSKAAGGLISPYTIEILKRRKIDVSSYLCRHDSFNLLSKLNSNIYAGYTGTNLNDVYLFVRKN